MNTWTVGWLKSRELNAEVILLPRPHLGIGGYITGHSSLIHQKMCPRGQENSRGLLIPLLLPGKIVKTCAKIYEKSSNPVSNVEGPAEAINYLLDHKRKHFPAARLEGGGC